MLLQEKIAVVTGASMGIGEAIARRFVQEGAQVVLSSRDAGRVEEARARIRHLERTLAVACDVNRRDDLERLLQTTLSRFGRVDIWVNNAGFGLIDSVAHMDMAECRRMFDTNLFAVVDAIQLVAPVMKKQGSGSIINISSIAGHISVPYMSAYGATKHALNCISKAARLELREFGVHVLTVCPGYIATDFAKNTVKGAEGKRIMRAGKGGISAGRVADAVLQGYLQKKREIVVPWRDRIIINLYRALPRMVERVMMDQMRPTDDVIAAAEAARKG